MAVAEIEVLDRAPTLEELGERASHQYERAMVAAGSAIALGIEAGRTLLEAYAIHGRLGWMGWIAENFSGSYEWANVFMKMAENPELVRDLPTINRARLVLRGVRSARYANGKVGYPKDVRDEACQRVAAGESRASVAEDLGVNRKTIGIWINPEATERRRRAAREFASAYRQAGREAAARKRDLAIKRAVRKEGGALAELYAQAERMQDVMGQAHREATDRDRRAALAVAGQHYRKMRDEIVRALGVS